MSAKGAWKDYKHYRDTAIAQKNNGRASSVINAFIGGPAGWYKEAAGEGGIGGNYGEHHADFGLSEADYEAMTDEEHDAYEKMNQNQRASFLEKMRTARKTEADAAAAQKAEEDKLAKQRADREAAQDDLVKKLSLFADEMNMSVDQLMQRDDVAKALNEQTFQHAARAGGGAGPGGLSAYNTRLATEQALIGYRTQRQGMAQQAWNQAHGMLGNQMNQAEDIARYNQGLNLQLQEAEAARQQAAYAQRLGAQQGLGGMIGGIAGAYFGGPTGAAMGQQVGSQLAGQRYQQNNPYKAYQFKYPSSSRPKGGGGLGGMGGNY